MPGFTQSVTGHATVRSAAELDNESFFRSALYNEIWKPQGLHSRIEAIVRGARGLPLGSLVLYRAPRERAFSRDDEELLGTLAPYVARGLEGHATLPTDYVTRRDRRGVITLGADGQLRQLSAQAHKLLLLAHGGIRRSTAATAPRREDFPTLTYLYQQYWRDGAQTTVTNGTSLRVENDWGQFVFEAERLNGVGGVPSMLTVTVHHLEPESAAARRGVDALPVSVSQREVCALLYAGLSQGEIARKLSIAPSTVADHVKRIYNRLDVHSVAELAQRIDRGAATHT
jgi:DNA-binding CsgD family transcriptional regulator